MSSENIWFTLFLAGTGVLIIYYFITSKRRRRVRIHADYLGWEAEHGVPESELSHSVFLVGDAGAPLLSHPDPVLSLVTEKIKATPGKSTLVYLGDNIYPLGLPDEKEPSRKLAESRLLKLLETGKSNTGQTIYLSGNHDWRRGRKGGLKAVIRQERYISAYDKEQVMLPKGGEPGPVEVEVFPGVIVVVINTVWWLYRSWRGKRKEKNTQVEQDFFDRFRSIIEKNAGKHIIVTAHHPLYSKSFHGGKFTLKQHLFPLTELGKKWYIPIPLAGSLYPLYRKYIGSIEDISHPRYKQLRKRLLEILDDYKNVVFAAGHDHNLQYIHKHHHHFIVSGSGAKVTHVRGGGSALFTHAHKGFFEVSYYKDGSMWIGAWEPGKEGSVLAFSRRIPAGEAIVTRVDSPDADRLSA